MEEKEKIIEVIKAAMEKEKAMKDTTKETLEEQIEDVAVDQSEAVLDDDNNNTAEDAVIDLDDNSEEEDYMEKPESKKTGKSLFKNTKSKDLAAKDQKIEELNDRLIRTMAEFDNYRKRTEKEKSQMYEIGAKSIIEKILPVVDNFERGFSVLTDKEKEGAFAQGIEKIYKQLITSLEEAGVKAIEAVGNEFDPNLHNAVMHGEDDNLGENIISDEFQKGYMYRDMVVRHSMVKVVN